MDWKDVRVHVDVWCIFAPTGVGLCDISEAACKRLAAPEDQCVPQAKVYCFYQVQPNGETVGQGACFQSAEKCSQMRAYIAEDGKLPVSSECVELASTD